MTLTDNGKISTDHLQTLRTFIAFKLPVEVIASIQNLQQELRRYGFKVGWVRPAGIHLTLKFLGDVPVSEIEAISTAVVEAARGREAIDLEARGLGVFPGLRRPRVIWVGVAGAITALKDLQQRLDRNLEPLGFARERRPFKGHLTLGRIKGSIDTHKLIGAIKAVGGFESTQFRADELILFKSELKPTGAEYTPLSKVSLI